MAQIDREYERKQSLIQQAKAEWVKKTMPSQSKTEGGGSMFLVSYESPSSSDTVVFWIFERGLWPAAELFTADLSLSSRAIADSLVLSNNGSQ
jgi:hypothetical protein